MGVGDAIVVDVVKLGDPVAHVVNVQGLAEDLDELDRLKDDDGGWNSLLVRSQVDRQLFPQLHQLPQQNLIVIQPDPPHFEGQRSPLTNSW